MAAGALLASVRRSTPRASGRREPADREAAASLQAPATDDGTGPATMNGGGDPAKGPHPQPHLQPPPHPHHHLPHPAAESGRGLKSPGTRAYQSARGSARKMRRRRGRRGVDPKEVNAWGITGEEEGLLLAELKVTLLEAGVRYDEELHSDWTLTRFLRARDYDVRRAFTMFVNHLKWREDYGVDDILAKDFPEREGVLEVFPQGYHGVTKEGLPLYIQKLGGVDYGRLMAVTTEERVIQLFIQEYEKFIRQKLPACSAHFRRFTEKSVTVMDMAGVGLKHTRGNNGRITKKILSIAQDNYPELMGRTIIINAPSVMKVIFNLFKPILGARTVAKVEMHGKHCLPKLLQYVEPDQLPKDLGGTSEYTLLDDYGPWSEMAPEEMQTIMETWEPGQDYVSPFSPEALARHAGSPSLVHLVLDGPRFEKSLEDLDCYSPRSSFDYRARSRGGGEEGRSSPLSDSARSPSRAA